MKYEYVDPQVLDKQKNVLTPGSADFEIKAAEDTVSQSSQKDMIKLTVQVWDADGKSGNIFDYLVGSANCVWKIKEFCDSIGKPQWYAPGFELKADDLIGQTGKAIIAIEKSRDEKYGDRMKIKSYLPPKVSDAVKTSTPPPTKTDFVDDDVPF